MNRKLSHKILVVDDDPQMTRIVEDILSMHEYEVVVSHDGLEAIEKTNSEHIDLILMDLRMPILSGYWFCDAFRHRPQTKGIPIVVVSALSDDENVKKAYELGARAYLKKPFRSEELLDIVKKALS